MKTKEYYTAPSQEMVGERQFDREFQMARVSIKRQVYDHADSNDASFADDEWEKVGTRSLWE